MLIPEFLIFLLSSKADFGEIGNYLISFSIQLNEISETTLCTNLVFLHPVCALSPDEISVL